MGLVEIVAWELVEHVVRKLKDAKAEQAARDGLVADIVQRLQGFEKKHEDRMHGVEERIEVVITQLTALGAAPTAPRPTVDSTDQDVTSPQPSPPVPADPYEPRPLSPPRPLKPRRPMPTGEAAAVIFNRYTTDYSTTTRTLGVEYGVDQKTIYRALDRFAQEKGLEHVFEKACAARRTRPRTRELRATA